MTAKRKDSMFGRNTRKGFRGKNNNEKKNGSIYLLSSTVDIHFAVTKVTDLNKEDFNITD